MECERCADLHPFSWARLRPIAYRGHVACVSNLSKIQNKKNKTVRSWTVRGLPEHLGGAMAQPIAWAVDSGRSAQHPTGPWNAQRRRSSCKNCVSAGQERCRTSASSDCTDLHDLVMLHDIVITDLLSGVGDWLSVLDVRDTGRVDKFLVKARGSWQRKWSRRTRGSDQALGDTRQEQNIMHRATHGLCANASSSGNAQLELVGLSSTVVEERGQRQPSVSPHCG